MAEYTELQLKAKEEGIKSWHVKSDEVLASELAEKWATTPAAHATPPPAQDFPGRLLVHARRVYPGARRGSTAPMRGDGRVSLDGRPAWRGKPSRPSLPCPVSAAST